MPMFKTPGGLVVPYTSTDERRVTQALKRLHPGLFLDKDVDAWGRDLWIVRQHVGSEHPPIECLRWTDPDGTPRAPSMAIVDQLLAQEKRSRADVRTGKDLADSAVRVKQKARERARQEREDIFREHEPRLKAGHGRPVTITTPLRRTA